MATDAGRYGTRKQQVLLGVLVAALVVVLAFVWSGGWTSSAPAGAPRGASNTQARRPQGGRTTGSAEDLDVKLDALQAERPGPGEVERNPFRFEARRRAEAPAPDEPEPPEAEPQEPRAPSGPAQPPPIPLKFIGIIESPQSGRVAALSDGRRVFQGREGAIIEGRYRIVRIGVESIVIEYADGSGAPQTIRLSGQ